MNLSHLEIASLLPHAGAMVLIDGVLAADTGYIRCFSDNHRHPRHPLRHADRLHAITLLEYAAQAMAVHGGLTQPDRRGQVAFLAAVRDLVVAAVHLDTLPDRLIIEATRLLEGPDGVIYETRVEHRGQELMHGRLTVMTPRAPQDETAT